MIKDEVHDIQGIIVGGYPDLTQSRFFFIAFKSVSTAKEWLKGVVPEITSADWKRHGREQKPDKAVSLAFTYQGLVTINYPEEGRKEFSAEFIAGMANSERALRLGDLGSSAPEAWDFGGPNNDPIHALLMLKGRNEDDLEKLERTLFRDHLVTVVTKQQGTIRQDHKEHFGFRDGISQPEIGGSPAKSRGTKAVPGGEFVLGYPNAYGMFPPTPTLEPTERTAMLQWSNHAPGEGGRRRDFGRNGTYLVFRKLHQNVAEFRDFLRRNAATPEGQDRLGARMVGRWRSGAPLVLYPTQDPKTPDPQNDFGYYSTDSEGARCPIGAHIRRANPRDDLEHGPEPSLQTVERHRILRRGTPYGPELPEGALDDRADRGLHFICLNSDIRRQFEFVQQTWLNSPKFSGLTNDRDPLVGSARQDDMTIQGSPHDALLRRRIHGLPQFVTTKGGGYFFLPGMAALRYLTTL